MKPKIMIVGHGFVGKAVDYGFSNCNPTVVDPKYGTDIDNYNVLDFDCIFVCVPTPFGSGGSIDASIVNSIVRRLAYCKLVVVKSTVTPDVVKHWPNNVVYNPEFLTEKSANEQFISPQFHIFGGDDELSSTLQEIYEKHSLCSPCPVYHMSSIEASFVKYTINSFLATKVTFFNQLYDAVNDTDASFETIIKAVGMDPRIGHSHTKVPGFDGKQGYGGACFPKDTSAFANYSDKMSLLRTAIDINNTYRRQYQLDDREKEQRIDYG